MFAVACLQLLWERTERATRGVPADPHRRPSGPDRGVVISHDRRFFNRVATHILAFEGESKVTLFDAALLGREAGKASCRRYVPVATRMPPETKATTHQE